MPRATNGAATQRRHTKIVRSARGYRGARHKIYRIAKQIRMRALWFSYRDRRTRKRDFRRLWITRINAASRQYGLPYNRLIEGLTKAGVQVDRKMLAELAVHDTAAFKELVDVARANANIPVALVKAS
jgi:large subunit ribosomal protein L20